MSKYVVITEQGEGCVFGDAWALGDEPVVSAGGHRVTVYDTPADAFEAIVAFQRSRDVANHAHVYRVITRKKYIKRGRP